MKISLSQRLHLLLFAPIDVASLVYYRVVFGAVMLWEAFYYLYFDQVAVQFLRPAYLFTFRGFDWVKPWPGDGLYFHFVAIGMLAVLVATGALYRLASGLLLLAFAYVFLLDQVPYLNHFYLMLLVGLVMAAAPAHRALSFDVKTGIVASATHVAAWPLLLLRTTMGLCYFYAGVAKLDSDWLAGYPLTRWFEITDRVGPLAQVLSPHTLGLATSWAGLLFDLAIWPALLLRRTRVAALVAAAGFHGINSWIWDIGVFPWLSIATTLLFLPPDWPRRLLRLPPRPAPALERQWAPRQVAVAAAVIALLALQVAVPLRPLFYSGQPSWTENGQLFSWRQKLRSKDGVVRFRLRDPVTGVSRFVAPETLMDNVRARFMATRPDLMLQYAKHLAALSSPPGGAAAEVYALGKVSLNGREPQPLIDPLVDLAKQQRTFLAPYDFVMPLEVPLSAQMYGGQVRSKIARRLLERLREEPR